MDLSISFFIAAIGWLAAVLLAVTRMALLDISGGMVRRLEERHSALSEWLDDLLDKRNTYRVLIRLLFLVDLLFLIYGVSNWYELMHEQSVSTVTVLIPIAAGILGFFLLTEWLGHRLSALATARFLRVSVPLIRLIGFPLLPFAAVIAKWHEWADGRLELQATDEQRTTTEDEIMSLVEQDENYEHGEAELEADERRMIRGVFDLDETLVHEIMTPRVDIHAVEDTATLAEVKEEIVTSGHSRIPVYSESIDHVIGLIFAKDLLDDEKVGQLKTVQNICHRPLFIPANKNIGDLLAEFQQERTHFAIVLDEYGGTAGIVTFEDILEEIVGEIRDEYDFEESQPAWQLLEDGFYLFDARVSIDELNEHLDLELPEEEDYDTLGGYIATAAEKIPQVGEIIETEDLLIEITAADQRHVIQAKVQVKKRDEEEDEQAKA